MRLNEQQINRMQKRRKLSAFFIIVGILVIASGIALGGYNVWESGHAGAIAQQAMGEISQHWQQLLQTNEGMGAMVGALPDFRLHPEMDMPVMEVDGRRYIGAVSIPVLDLELPILEEWNYTNLRIAPCRYMGSAYLNDLIVCAHNYASHFGRLRNLQPGDEVRFTDVDGNIFCYHVEQVETLEKYAIEEMQSGQWDLTLFTCTLGGQTRVTVRCSWFAYDHVSNLTEQETEA